VPSDNRSCLIAGVEPKRVQEDRAAHVVHAPAAQNAAAEERVATCQKQKALDVQRLGARMTQCL